MPDNRLRQLAGKNDNVLVTVSSTMSSDLCACNPMSIETTILADLMKQIP